MTKTSSVKAGRTVMKVTGITIICFLLGTLLIFAFSNAAILIRFLKNDRPKTYSVSEVALTRWVPLEGEHLFCSEDDPIVVIWDHNGYIQSVELHVVPMQGTPECDIKIYWTDGQNPDFTEQCSQFVPVKKIETGYIIAVNRYVKDLRFDLYNGAGAVVQIEGFTVNPGTLAFSDDLVFPVFIASLCFSLYLCIYRHADVSDGKLQDTSALAGNSKVQELDFIRTVCAIGIILFHVSGYLPQNIAVSFQRFANGDYGILIVNVFFIISGGVLYYNYKNTGNLIVFYYKRWKSIFPMFYVTYLFFFIRNVVITNRLFYNGTPQRFLLTVFGLDGYFNYKYPGYYIVGEWFLGAIVLLYALYPVFLKLVNTMGWKILFFVLPMVGWQNSTNWFEIDQTKNIIYCSSLFIIGMLMFKYRLYKLKVLKLVAFCSSIIVLCIPIPGIGLYQFIVVCIFIFLALFLVAEYIIKIQSLKRMFAYLGSLTFPMFLIQNKVVYFTGTNIVTKTKWETLQLILLTVCLSVLGAWCIKSITQGILRAKWFLRMDKAILSLSIKGE